MQDLQLHDLIARCALNDQKALKLLYESTSAYLNKVAFNIVRSEEWSNDVLQDAFIQIWKNATSYRPDISKPLTWMSSIVRYRALDKLRLEKRHFSQTSGDEIVDALPSGILSPDKSIEIDEEHQSFVRCLNTLNERGKKCIQLAYLHGYSREELALTFNTNSNTVKSWLHRNIKRLKTCLEQNTPATN